MKNALLISIVMLLCCCLVMIGCANSEKSPETQTPLERAQEEVEKVLISKITAKAIMNDADISYVNCTFTKIKDLGDNNYKFSGTVTAKENGRNYTANYTATVKYNAANDNYNASVEVGTFK